jgi:hypothetical protein
MAHVKYKILVESFLYLRIRPQPYELLSRPLLKKRKLSTGRGINRTDEGRRIYAAESRFTAFSSQVIFAAADS